MTGTERSIGLLGATGIGIGVGAIVGGGILALAGVAFATTVPSAIRAFGLNGLIALVTALSFAELATRFPEWHPRLRDGLHVHPTPGDQAQPPARS